MTTAARAREARVPSPWIRRVVCFALTELFRDTLAKHARVDGSPSPGRGARARVLLLHRAGKVGAVRDGGGDDKRRPSRKPS